MKCKLSDIADITMGQSPKSEYYNSNGNGMPFLQGNRTFGYKKPFFDTYTTLATKTAKAGDVIMSVRAPVGDLNIAPVDLCLGRGVCSLHMKNGNQEFLYYLMKFYMPHLLNKESGTVFGSVNRNDISSLEIDIPESEAVQAKISRILSMLDDKIELNNAINCNLEQQAQALFNNLFPNCMSNAVPINSIVDVRDGTHDSPKSETAGRFLITSKHLLPYSVNKSEANLISETDFQHINERSKVEYGDVLISMIGTVGVVSFVSEKNIDFAIKNIGLFRTSQNERLRLYVLFYLKSVLVANHIQQHLAGSTQKYISLSELRNLPIYVPNEQAIASFNELTIPLVNQIITNVNANQRLSALRDTLLPKLMSGEIDVSEVEI